MKSVITIFAALLSLLLSCAGVCNALTDDEVLKLQSSLKGLPTGERIALAAESFVGTPYDPDPRGEYVTRKAIVADERVDCMYLVFRAVELALSSTPEEAVRIALDKRFRSKGVLAGGKVANYDDRFEFGEDMIPSGKWGREITGEIGMTVRINGSRGKGSLDMLTPRELVRGMRKLKSGDIVFFIKAPGRRQREEIVGHMGIIKTETGKVFLIHASGRKGKGGAVKKVSWRNYVRGMPFIGAMVARFP
ncbi:MAG TPA: hypothetical protein VF790_00165 [Dissulfurispiraceae bacterium]